MRYPLTAANVPIAVNVDERLGSGILDRLRGDSWNPELFNYPTFYYYLTVALVTPLGFDNVLQHGRVVNLLIGCALAVATVLVGATGLWLTGGFLCSGRTGDV